MGGDNFPSSSVSFQSHQQPRKLMDLSQQLSPHQLQVDGQSKGHGNKQQDLNPAHQAYLQHAYQSAQQMAAFGIQSQQKPKLEMGQLADHAHSLRRPSNPSSDPQWPVTDQRNEQKPQVQLMSPSGQLTQAQHCHQNIGKNPMAMAAQLQAWAFERNIDLSHPTNAKLVAQLIPLMQSGTMISQKNKDGNSQPPLASDTSQHVTSCPVASEDSPRANSWSEVSGQPGSLKRRQVHAANLPMHHISAQSREKQGPSEQPSSLGTELSSMQTKKSQVSLSQALAQSSHGKSKMTGQETTRNQYVQNSSLSGSGCGDGGSGDHIPPQSGTSNQVPSQRIAFTKQQMHVFKAQILAFRRIKKGESALPQELLHAISPPPLELQLQQPVIPTLGNKQDQSAGRTSDENASCKVSQDVQTSTKQNSSKEEKYMGDQKENAKTAHTSGANAMTREMIFSCKEDGQALETPIRPEPVSGHGGQKTLSRNDLGSDMKKATSLPASASETQLNKTVQTGSVPETKDAGHNRKYNGPLFDFPFFTRRPDSVTDNGATTSGSSTSNESWSTRNVGPVMSVGALEKMMEDPTVQKMVYPF